LIRVFSSPRRHEGYEEIKLRALRVFVVNNYGDYIKFKHPDKQGHVVVPHPRKDVALGTLRNIYRQAGWEWQ